MQRMFKSTCKQTHARDRQAIREIGLPLTINSYQKLERLAVLSVGTRQIKAVSELSCQELI